MMALASFAAYSWAFRCKKHFSSFVVTKLQKKLVFFSLFVFCGRKGAERKEKFPWELSAYAGLLTQIVLLSPSSDRVELCLHSGGRRRGQSGLAVQLCCGPCELAGYSASWFLVFPSVR